MSKLVETTRTERQVLKNILPLETPFSIDFFVTNVCNFRCRYCDIGQRQNVAPRYMTFETFCNAIDGMKKFPQKIKSMSFTGGEPLLHKDIVRMVKYAKEAEVSSAIQIITNASLLTRDLSEKLIDAGLDILRVSLQGVVAETYWELCGAKINYNEFVDNIKYLYDRRKSCRVIIKAFQNTVESEQQLEDIYGDICDMINIQNILNLNDTVAFSKENPDNEKGIYQANTNNVQICTEPFYKMMIDTDGTVFPCCRLSLNSIQIGNVNEESLYNMFSGEKLYSMQMLQLNGRRFSHSDCSDCRRPNSFTQSEDLIDEQAALDIIERIKLERTSNL